MNKGLKFALVSIAVIVLAAILQYFVLVPLNFGSFGFWFFGALILVFIGLILIFFESYDGDLSVSGLITGGIGLGVFVIAIIIAFFGSALFNASSYAKLTKIEEGTFQEGIPSPLDTSIMDVQTAVNIGSRNMGEIDNISQFEISDEYNMIEYQGEPYRVSPLEYADEFKALGNDGISGYILVNCKTQEGKLVKLDDKIYYAPSAVFSHDLTRHIHSEYKSKILGKFQFEIDDEGKPYYIVPTYKKTIGLFGGEVLDTVLIVDAHSGDITEYEVDKLPEWVDHTDSVSHMMGNVTTTYKYVNGFWNTVFAKKGIKTVSYDYRSGDDYDFKGYSSMYTSNGIGYFTGVTSANSDESILGFLFLNPKNGQVTFYPCVGAEESSAQASAEALVQNFGYKASYPFVVNVDGIETYMVALKDKTGTNKAYSFVNVKNYTIATQASTKEEALAQYKKLITNKGTNSEGKNDVIEAKVVSVQSAVENGTTYFYYVLEGREGLYVSSITNNRKQILLKNGDNVKIEAEYVDNYYLVTKIEF